MTDSTEEIREAAVPPPPPPIERGVIEGEDSDEYWVDAEAAKEFEDREAASNELTLWDAKQIAQFSLILTPVFGFYFQWLNWIELGVKDEIKTSLLWLKGSAAYVILSLILAIALPTQMGWAVIKVMFLMYAFAWYFSNAKNQRDYIEKTFGPGYKRKPWGFSIYMSMTALIVAVLLMVGVSFLS